MSKLIDKVTNKKQYDKKTMEDVSTDIKHLQWSYQSGGKNLPLPQTLDLLKRFFVDHIAIVKHVMSYLKLLIDTESHMEDGLGKASKVSSN